MMDSTQSLASCSSLDDDVYASDEGRKSTAGPRDSLAKKLKNKASNLTQKAKEKQP